MARVGIVPSCLSAPSRRDLQTNTLCACDGSLRRRMSRDSGATGAPPRHLSAVTVRDASDSDTCQKHSRQFARFKRQRWNGGVVRAPRASLGLSGSNQTSFSLSSWYLTPADADFSRGSIPRYSGSRVRNTMSRTSSIARSGAQEGARRVGGVQTPSQAQAPSTVHRNALQGSQTHQEWTPPT